MDRMLMREPRRGLSATAMVVRPRCPEEAEFVKAFANTLNHATAVVASDPETPFPAGSVAERIRKAYLRFRPDKQPAIQQRARERLSGSRAQRDRYFGAYADLGAEAWARAEPGLERGLRQQLKQAVQARLKGSAS